MRFISSLIATLALTLAMVGCASTPEAPTMENPLEAPQSLEVSSPDFAEGSTLAKAFEFDKFGCTGDNVRPSLKIDNVPAGTKGFAVVVHDPDAPTGVGFFHWVAVDIPADTRVIDSSTHLRELHTDYGQATYGGPCPPPGNPHRYIFTVYALDTDKLPVPDSATGALTRFMLKAHTLGYGRTTGVYGRSGS